MNVKSRMMTFTRILLCCTILLKFYYISTISVECMAIGDTNERNQRIGDEINTAEEKEIEFYPKYIDCGRFLDMNITNLRNDFTNNGSLTVRVAGYKCFLKEKTTNLMCAIDFARVPCPEVGIHFGRIEVKQNTKSWISKEKFAILESNFTTFSPKVGLKSGGTVITFSGTFFYLNQPFTKFSIINGTELKCLPQKENLKNETFAIFSKYNCTVEKPLPIGRYAIQMEIHKLTWKRWWFEIKDDPTIDSVSSDENGVKNPEGTPRGDAPIYVKGDGFDNVQSAEFCVLNDVDKCGASCKITSNTTMTCYSPALPPPKGEQKLHFGFKINGMKVLYNYSMSHNQSFILKPEEDWLVLFYTIPPLFLFCSICIILCKKKSDGKEIKELEKLLFGTLYKSGPLLPQAPSNITHFDPNAVQTFGTLGEGEFGIVVKGIIKNHPTNGAETNVAVKILRAKAESAEKTSNFFGFKKKETDNYENLRALIMELRALSLLENHKNVIHLHGAVTKHLKNGKLYIIIELCRESVLKYLERNRKLFIDQINYDADTIDRSIVNRIFSTDMANTTPGYVNMNNMISEPKSEAKDSEQNRILPDEWQRVGSRRAKAEGKKTSTTGSFHMVLARGFPWKVTKSDVISFFKGVKILNNEKGVNIMKNVAMEAYVELASKADAKKALAFNDKQVDSRTIRVSEVDAKEYSRVASCISETNDSKVVQIGGLPWSGNKTDIIDLFPTIKIQKNQIKIEVEKNSRRRTGYAFVEFETVEDYDAAFKTDFSSVNQFIKLFKATKEQFTQSIATNKWWKPGICI